MLSGDRFAVACEDERAFDTLFRRESQRHHLISRPDGLIAKAQHRFAAIGFNARRHLERLEIAIEARNSLQTKLAEITGDQIGRAR